VSEKPTDHTYTPTVYTRTSTRHQGKRLTESERTHAQEVFLQAYALNGNILLSCRRANIDRSTFYEWQEKDEEFSILWHQAEKDFADIVLAEFMKRAMTGYEKPTISMGKIVYHEGKPLMERVVSDNLLAMAVKRHFPEFRDKQSLDLNATVHGKVDSTNTLRIDVRSLSPEQLTKLKELAADMRDTGGDAT